MSGGEQRSCKCWVDRRIGNLFTISTIYTRLIIAQQFAYAHNPAQTSLPRRNKLNESPEQSEKEKAMRFIAFLWSGERGIRTPETLLGFTRFPGGPVQPLLHLSSVATAKIVFFAKFHNKNWRTIRNLLNLQKTTLKRSYL